MGTNYYLQTTPPCECCLRPFTEDEQHIGKSSGGWCFTLHVEKDGAQSLSDWIDEWKRPGNIIMNEYGEQVSIEEMEKIITERGWNSKQKMSEIEMHKNGAIEGPNGLLRHKVDGRHCVGNGEGTWDLMAGYFR